MSLNDNNQKTLIERALDLHKSGKINDAISLYLELIKNEEKNPKLLFLLGTAYVQSNKTKEGIGYLKKSLSIKPTMHQHIVIWVMHLKILIVMKKLS